MKRGHQFFKTDIQAAMNMYDRSILFNQENFEAYYWRGVAEYNEQDSATALADLETAIDINPHHFASYQMIDRVLARSRQWGRIIGYWNRFLALEPDHAGAHLELAGTHHHNKDVDQSRTHLEKACELGSQEACRLSTRMGMRSS
jgi:tetratricopeptide (TPR) repeat protein